jgi:hypothetical protein
MVLKITNKCYMNCTHCMEDSNYKGEHMSDRVFIDTIKFIKNLKFHLLIISGGEPTLNPNIINYINILNKKFDAKLVVASNGYFLKNQNLINQLKDTGAMIQITNDKKFYPTKVKNPNLGHPFEYYDYIGGKITPLGRGKFLDEKTYRDSPMCFNFRSLFKEHKNIYHVLFHLEFGLYKFCSLSIGIKGDVYISECSNCTPIGTIYDSFETLNKNIQNFKCNNCGLYNKLGIQYRVHVGEL